MNVITEGWFWIETEDEWMDICPEADDIPEEFPVAVQTIETNEGILFSTMPTELGTYLWNAPGEIQFIADFDFQDKEDKYH